MPQFGTAALKLGFGAPWGTRGKPALCNCIFNRRVYLEHRQHVLGIRLPIGCQMQPAALPKPADGEIDEFGLN